MDVFNNRELASATLMIVMSVWAWRKSNEVKKSIYEFLKSLLQGPIMMTLLTLVIYVLMVVYFLSKLQIWNSTQIKNTILWFLFVGVVQLSGTTKITDMKTYLKGAISNQIKLIVILEFLVAFHSYGYFTEIILVSVVTLSVACSIVSGNKIEHKQAKRVFDTITLCIGMFIFLGSMLNIYEKPLTFFNIDTFRDFLIPLVLSVSLLPYIYCFYYFMYYENIFVKFRIYTNDKSLQRYAKIKSLISFHGNVRLMEDWVSYSCIPEFESKESIIQSIKKYKEKHCRLES
ncbi:hypothetical protein M2R28_01550 [Aeromonas hydrophila]|uniref:hypothetical protein n=1 Tax=Aeromonas hydrophila TaxID=644 RepID=UPI001F4C27DE|nr:hypothetical protein [Aeromonas hydrophila]MCO4198375.1 hypothetical protein [Aeromonas hydrophila]UNB59695.1 hypothetical protein MKW86_06305 [Aeromonas hydrophila]